MSIFNILLKIEILFIYYNDIKYLMIKNVF